MSTSKACAEVVIRKPECIDDENVFTFCITLSKQDGRSEEFSDACNILKYPVSKNTYQLTSYFIIFIELLWKEKEERYIPNITEDPDNSFVNFISLAESVALAPTLDLWISFDALWLVLEDFVWLTEELAFVLLLFWSSS